MQIVGTIAELWRFPVKSMGGEQLASVILGPDGVRGDRGWALRDDKAGEIRGAKKLPALLRCEARYVTEPNGGDATHVRIELPNGETLLSSDPDASKRLSLFLNRPVSLWPRQPASDLEHYRRALPDGDDFEAELRAIFGRLRDEPLPDLTIFPPALLEFTSPLGTYFDAFPLHVLTSATLARLSELNRDSVFDLRRFRPNLFIATPASMQGFVELEWAGGTLEIGEAAIGCEMRTVRCSMTTHEQKGLAKDPSILRTIVRDADQNVGMYASVVRPGHIRVGDEVRLA